MRARGFTLIEMLVALALLALLSALLVAGLRLSRNAVLTSETATERLLRTERALDLIRRQLQQAEPLPLAAGVDPPPVAFAGDGASIVFIAPPAAYLARGGEQVTWLVLEHTGAGARLVLRFRPLDRASDRWPLAEGGTDLQSAVLLDDIAGARFSFFGRAAPGADARWLADWRNEPALPDLIRVTVTGGGEAWPDLVVAPALGRPAGTGLLQLTGPLCRRESETVGCP